MLLNVKSLSGGLKAFPPKKRTHFSSGGVCGVVLVVTDAGGDVLTAVDDVGRVWSQATSKITLIRAKANNNFPSLI